MYNCYCIFGSQHHKHLVEWMGDFYVLSNSISVIIGQFSVLIKLSAGQRFPTELPGFLVTFILVVLLVNTSFLTLVTMFNVLLVMGTKMEWHPR